VSKLSKVQERILSKSRLPDGKYQKFYSSWHGDNPFHGWLAQTRDKFRQTTLDVLLKKGILERTWPDNEPYWRRTYSVTEQAKKLIEAASTNAEDGSDD
jgi:hypothetical protein